MPNRVRSNILINMYLRFLTLLIIFKKMTKPISLHLLSRAYTRVSEQV